MTRYAWPTLSLLVAVAIQGNLPSFVSVFGVQPDLVLVVLIAYSLAADPAFGAGLGFIAGLIHGSAVGMSVGSFIVTRTLTGLLAGLVTTRLFSENPVVPALSAFWLTLACEGAFVFANPRVRFAHVVGTILVKCAYNALLALAINRLLRHIETRRKIRLANARI